MCQRDSRLEVSLIWIGKKRDRTGTGRLLRRAAEVETSAVIDAVLEKCAPGERQPIECVVQEPGEQPAPCR